MSAIFSDGKTPEPADSHSDPCRDNLRVGIRSSSPMKKTIVIYSLAIAASAFALQWLSRFMPDAA